jgi:hypothetical protein
MTYPEFLKALASAGWSVPNKSFAYSVVGNEWQISFVRLRGRWQIPGHVTFVICVRHTSLRDLAGDHHPIEMEPHCHPFKFTIEDIQEMKLRYQSKLLNYEMNTLAVSGDWSPALAAVTDTIPKWLASYSKTALHSEIQRFGQGGYIEKIWLADLANA